MFKHNLGAKARCIITGMSGIITSRSECLYGCNRYFVNPPVDKGNKYVEGWWIDEDQLEVTGQAVLVVRKDTGGPMSQIR